MDKKKKKENVDGISKEIESHVLHNANISRDELKERLLRELTSCIVFMRDVVSLPDTLDALTDVYYARYTKFHKEAKEKAMEDLQKISNQVQMFPDQEGGSSNGR